MSRVVFEHPVDWQTVYACSDGIVQPIVKTWDEVVAHLTAGEPFICEIIEDGQVLFGADSAYDRLRHYVADAYERWGLERTPLGWRWAAG